MCTLAVWVGAWSEAPLVVAANRDEFVGRPSTGPRWWDGPVPFLAPRDEREGGTWWALSAAGLFVGITNRFGVANDPGRRSRGLLVADVARVGSVAAARAFVAGLSGRAFNGFHLLVADRNGGFLAVGDGSQIAVHVLGPGRHVVSERSYGAAERSRDAAVVAALDGVAGGELSLEALGRALATHGPSPIESVCVHLPEFDYATRSSTVLAVGHDSVRLRFASGAPCTVAYEQLDALAAQGVAIGA